MHILVLQHAEVEHPGVFRQFLAEDGHSWDIVELNKGQPLPDIAGYDGLWVMGGPMDVWQEDAHPWLKDEKAFIRDAVEERGLPFLGFCLGHQLLAEALGGEVGKSATPEIGICQVQLTDQGASGVFFDGLPTEFQCLQWHSAEIQKIPAGAQVLATSPECVVQAMKWGTRAFSFQFHVETEADAVAEWAKIPEYSAALEQALGQGATARLESDYASHIKDFNTMAERIYMNWLQTSAQA